MEIKKRSNRAILNERAKKGSTGSSRGIEAVELPQGISCWSGSGDYYRFIIRNYNHIAAMTQRDIDLQELDLQDKQIEHLKKEKSKWYRRFTNLQSKMDTLKETLKKELAETIKKEFKNDPQYMRDLVKFRIIEKL